MDNHQVSRAPNYTSACIVMFGVNIAWLLVAIWAVWGLIAALLLGVGVNHLIERMTVWAHHRQAASIRRGKSR